MAITIRDERMFSEYFRNIRKISSRRLLGIYLEYSPSHRSSSFSEFCAQTIINVYHILGQCFSIGVKCIGYFINIIANKRSPKYLREMNCSTIPFQSHILYFNTLYVSKLIINVDATRIQYICVCL